MSAIAISVTAAATLIAAAGGATYAALDPQSQIFGKILIAPAKPNELALTYDDGPNPAATPQLLDILAAANVRATFFLIGHFVRQCPKLTQDIQAAGHLIGNHTMAHPWLAWQSTTRIRQELADCNAALEDTLGSAVHFFRPPHGSRRPVVLSIARDLGLASVNWNVIANDWNPVDSGTIFTSVRRGIARNQQQHHASNILLHDGSDQILGADRLATVDATSLLLDFYRQTSFNFVTPEEWI